MTEYNQNSTGGIVCGGLSRVKINNPIFVSNIEVGDNVFYLQKTKVHAAVVVSFDEDSEDKFYEIQLVRLPGWEIGDSDSFIVHESKLLPVLEDESYNILREIF